MTSNQKRIAIDTWMLLYWIILMIWALWILIYIFSTVSIIYDTQRIKEAPREAYFEYNDVSSKKSNYELWERLVMISDRSIRRTLEIWWQDKLHCEVNETDWYQLISEKKWNNLSPDLVEDNTWSWTYEGALPENPIWTYIWWSCYMRSIIQMCEKWICKKQIVRSNDFTIWK